MSVRIGFILRSQVGKIRRLATTFGSRRASISDKWTPKTPKTPKEYIREMKAEEGKRREQGTIQEVWGSEIEAASIEFTAELENNSEANWSKAALSSLSGRNEKRAFSSAASPPSDNNGDDEGGVDSTDYAKELRREMEAEFTERSVWKSIMGIVGSQTHMPPGAIREAVGLEKSNVEEGGGEEEGGEEEKKTRITGDTSSISDWKF